MDLSPETEDLAAFRAALREVSDAFAAMAGAAGSASRRLAAAKSALRATGVKRRRKAPPQVRERVQESAAPAPVRLTWVPTSSSAEPARTEEAPSSGVTFDFEPSPGDSCAGGDW